MTEARVRPSETPEARLWLENFGAGSLTAPLLLLDSLRVVSATTMRASLVSLVTKLVEQSEPPIAVLPVRAVDDQRPYFARGEESLPEYFRRSALPGSEAVVANAIRDLKGNRELMNRVIWRPTLGALRGARCRTLLLVDDYAGSGGRVTKFATALLRTPSIRSWRSYGLIRLHVASFAASSLAKRTIEHSKHVDGLTAVEYGVDFDSTRWTDEELQEVRALCRSSAFNEEWALGYDDSEGLFVMQHTVPNNLPAVLWQSSGRNGRPWKPFFTRPTMTPRQQLALSDYSPFVTASDIASGFRQFRLARRLDASYDPSVRTLLLVLGALGRGIRKTERLAVELGISTFQLDDVLGAARELGLVVGPGNHLSDEGRQELRRARVRPRRVTLQLDGDDAPYYPSRLRGSR